MCVCVLRETPLSLLLYLYSSPLLMSSPPPPHFVKVLVLESNMSELIPEGPLRTHTHTRTPIYLAFPPLQLTLHLITWS